MPNALIHESSPYLLQHAHNPVDWYPWGEAALEKARQENKMILVSIGYAACHWCHVMEHESFEDEAVADLMNTHFVCIKVDREERPDIDKIYMDAVQLLTRRGGWPLNAFALPDGRPFYGGTYFPKTHWMSVLQQLAERYEKEPKVVEEYAANLSQAIRQVSPVVKIEQRQALSHTDLEIMWARWKPQLDLEWGGRKSETNKFPLPANNLLLLRASFLSGSAEMFGAVGTTLTKMAFGGIYDQLGGGFSRYSVDPYWKAPHFEKMLYDNGQLVSLYAEAWQQDPQDLYRKVVYQTLAFIEREMTDEEGGFYASLDADSEGEEGKFYVWDHAEIASLLGEDAKLFSDYYNVGPQGNWEGHNILFVLETEAAFARRWQLGPKEVSAKLAAAREKLFASRSKRIRPGLDDKILCSWNALMLKGYVDAYRIFGEARFLDIALRNARFLANKLSEGGRLFRNYKAGRASINAFLDDYALLIDAYLALYQVTFDPQWLERAHAHVAHVRDHFYDEASGMFFYTSDEETVLVTRKIETQDDVIPSSNAVLAESLHTLSLLLHRPDYRELSAQMLTNVQKEVLENPAWFARWGQLALRHMFPHFEIAITGPEALSRRLAFEKHYGPNRLYAGAEQASELPILQDRFAEQTTIYICQENTCQLPVHTIPEALDQMR